MMKRLLLASLLVLAGACGDDGSDGTPKDGKLIDAGADAPSGPDASCFENPQTHNEIINACTDAEKIYKDSNPPLLNPDGTLPPLP